MNSFSDFGLLPSLLKTLKDMRINKPTEIQKQIIPMLMGGQSAVGVSETGSGKTLAYALPLLHALKALEDEGSPVEQEASPRAIVMVPSRELGEQVSKVFKTLTHTTRLRVRPALGGMAMEQARRNTSGPFEILLATPGRLIQLLDQELINLTDVRVLIFDEADQMLDQGFLPDSNRIVNTCPEEIQLALFSATVSTAVQEMMNDLFASAEIVRSKGSGKVVSSLVTKNMIVEDGQRWPLLEKLLAQKIEGGTMLFTNTREQCDKLAKELTEKGHVCAVYRGEMDKNERRMNLRSFRDGKIELLVSTDLAGRGLDIENVGRIINFHLPKQMDNYLHRAGRTARAGRKGLVVNLVTERDQRLIEKLTGSKLVFKPRPNAKDQNVKGSARDERQSRPTKATSAVVAKTASKSTFSSDANFKSKSYSKPNDPRAKTALKSEKPKSEFKAKTSSGKTEFKPKTKGTFKERSSSAEENPKSSFKKGKKSFAFESSPKNEKTKSSAPKTISKNISGKFRPKKNF
jgi:superfamily II DNA/RNA helicase